MRQYLTFINSSRALPLPQWPMQYPWVLLSNCTTEHSRSWFWQPHPLLTWWWSFQLHCGPRRRWSGPHRNSRPGHQQPPSCHPGKPSSGSEWTRPASGVWVPPPCRLSEDRRQRMGMNPRQIPTSGAQRHGGWARTSTTVLSPRILLVSQANVYLGPIWAGVLVMGIHW